MTFLGVPIFDWVLLVVLLGFGVEAWITCRDTGEKNGEAKPEARTASDDSPTALPSATGQTEQSPSSSQ